jgi:hypothetical protein
MTPFGPALIHRSYDISIIWTLLHLAKIILVRSHPAMPPAAQMAAGVGAPATQPYATLIGRITAGMQLPMGEDLSPSLGAVLTESTLSLFFAGVQYQAPAQREWIITRLVDIDRRTGWASAGIIARGCETAWEKAATMGRGPPYRRRTRRVGEEGPLLYEETTSEASVGGRDGVDGESWLQRGGSIGERQGNEQRGFIVKNQPPPWALNLLGTEEDLRAGMERVGFWAYAAEMQIKPKVKHSRTRFKIDARTKKNRGIEARAQTFSTSQTDTRNLLRNTGTTSIRT